MAAKLTDGLQLWYFVGGAPAGLTAAEARAAIEAAAEIWPTVCGAAFQEVTEPDQADLLVSIEFSLDSAVERYPGQAAAWAEGTEVGLTDEPVTGSQPPYRMRLNAVNVNGWTAQTFQDTALHEFGHSIGIDHQQPPSCISAVEDPSIHAPQLIDIAVAQSLYGPPVEDLTAPDLAHLQTTQTFELTASEPGHYSLDLSKNTFAIPAAGTYLVTVTVEPKPQ